MSEDSALPVTGITLLRKVYSKVLDNIGSVIALAWKLCSLFLERHQSAA
jgi:hypothetical protein